MPHIKFQSSPLKSGNNSGSCGQLLNYLEKEDKTRDEEHELSGFFSSKSDGLSTEKAKEVIEHDFYKKGLKNDADKFYSVTMSFSQDELKGKSNEELKQFAQEEFSKMYVGAVKGRELDPENIAWVAKLETERKYKGTDQEVKEGIEKSGDLKEGDQRHIHFVVARKTLDDKQISPMSNHFREGADTGAVKSGFDQDHFKFECEDKFDKKFNHERQSGESIKDHLAPYRPDLVEKFRTNEEEKAVDKLKEIVDKQPEFKESAIKEQQEKLKEANEKWNESRSFLEKTKDTINRIIIEPIKAVADRILGRGTTVSKSSESINRTGSVLDRVDDKKQERERGEDPNKDKEKGNDLERTL